MKNRYDKSEDGSYAIFAPRRINGKPQEGFEIPFYISKEDFEQVNSMPGVWYADFNKGPGRLPYIKGKYNNKDVRLHRWIWEGRNGKIPDGFVIDHKNRIRVDHNWVNLRLATFAENATNKRKRSDKPLFDPNGLTRQGIIDIVEVDDDIPYHESAYVGSIFLGRYKPDSDYFMNWEFNIAKFLLFEELPRTEMYNRLNHGPIIEQQLIDSGFLTIPINQLRSWVDRHIASVLKKLCWDPPFLD